MAKCSCLGLLSSLRHNRKLEITNHTPAENDSKWPTLPHDLLLLIISKIPLPHHLRLREVCSSWANAFPGYRPLARQNLPWLILGNHSGEHNFTLLYSKERKSIHIPLLPKKDKIWCVGYKNGWFVIVHKLQILLLNPLTREQVQFPSFYTQQGVDHNSVPGVGKVILSSTPNSATTILAVAMADDNSLAYAKQSDRKWTPLRFAPSNCIHDVEFHDGRFCILYDGPVVGAEFFHTMRKFHLSAFKVSYEYVDRLQKFSIYLASCPSGDLLQILGIRNSDSHKCEKYIIKVLREGSVSRWVETEDLGGWSVFMDTLQCTFLPAADAQGLKENCIYIAKNYVGTSVNGILIDAGVFNIGRGIIEHGFPNMLHLEELRSVFPLWLTPSLS